MFADSFFQQGYSHEVCEDYALHGWEYAIVADGCTNGDGPPIDSDWGARILCKAAEQHLSKQNGKNWWSFCQAVLGTAAAQRNSFPTLNPRCLAATLMTLQRIENDLVAFMVGDGVIGAHRQDGGWRVEHYEFQPGGTSGQAAAYYPIYMTNEADAKNYFNKFGGMLYRRTYSGTFDPMDESPSPLMVLEEIRLDPAQPYVVRKFPVADYDRVFIGSDGLGTFTKLIQTETSKTNELVGIEEVMLTLLDIPAYRPGCLKLQRDWAFKRNITGSFLKRNWRHLDDVSMGMVCCGD